MGGWVKYIEGITSTLNLISTEKHKELLNHYTPETHTTVYVHYTSIKTLNKITK